MERDTYNLLPQDCEGTLSGPLCKPCLKLKTYFLGDNIYQTIPRTIDECDERHTYVDCRGNVKYTLPLDSYRELLPIREKIL